MRPIAQVVVSLILVAVGGATALAGEREYRVIVNSSRHIMHLSNEELAAYFLKRESKWSDGVPVAPVDLTMMSEVRRSFTEDVLAGSVNEILTYWERQIFSGRNVPPPVKGSDADVIAFVKANPGAIGYVSSRLALPIGVTAATVVRADDRAVRTALAQQAGR